MNTVTQMIIGNGSNVIIGGNSNETLHCALDVIAQQQQLISRLLDMQGRWIAEIDKLTQKTIEP